MEHVTKLKETYTGVDMKTLFERHLTMIAGKKESLPIKPEPPELKKTNNGNSNVKQAQQGQVQQQVHQVAERGRPQGNKSPIRQNENANVQSTP